MIFLGSVRLSLSKLRTNIWPFADQGVVSAASFILMVLVARGLGPVEFGRFVMAYTALLFINSIQAALLTQPHNVLGALKEGEAYLAYTSATFLMQLILSLGTAAMLLITAIGVQIVTGASGGLIASLALTSFTWQMQELVRRVYYTQSDYRPAFMNDLFSYGGQVLLVGALWRLDRLSAVAAVLAIGIASMAGSIRGLVNLHGTIGLHIEKTHVGTAFQENWTFGRWLLGGSLTSWVSGQLYPLLTAGFVGFASMGGLRASQNLVAPTHLLFQTLDNTLPSKAAPVYRTSGWMGLLRYIQSIAVPAGVAMMLYCGLLIAFAEPLTTALLGHAYSQYAWLAQVYALTYILMFMSSIASIILRSASVSSPMLYANALSAAFVLTAGVWLVGSFGLMGTAVGMVLHLLILNIVLWASIHRFLRKDQGTATFHQSERPESIG